MHGDKPALLPLPKTKNEEQKPKERNRKSERLIWKSQFPTGPTLKQDMT
jgi:hypothetical protein